MTREGKREEKFEDSDEGLGCQKASGRKKKRLWKKKIHEKKDLNERKGNARTDGHE